MPDENNFQLMLLCNQWYVVGNGFKMPVEDEMSGLLLIDQLDKEARNAKSDIASKQSADNTQP